MTNISLLRVEENRTEFFSSRICMHTLVRASNTYICCHGQQSLGFSCIRIFPSIQLAIFLFGENIHKPIQCNVPKSVEFICYPCVMRIFAMQDALRQTAFALGNLSTPFR